ncbi:class I SAM-dependent methyltransferase [Polynucleobacter paneuropaeus]|nr:class I SAM-dependent methyltransferase [Polynucleobacter paneuropaeus]
MTKIYTDGTYFNNNPTWDAEDSPWKARQIISALERNHLNPESICEVGCGAGEILINLNAQLPFVKKFSGYEISPQAHQLCLLHSHININFEMKAVDEIRETYDCLLCIDVFEHVPNYLEFISNLKTIASYKIFHIPLDISILSILNSSMIHARNKVGHLHYFTKDTALETLKDCGLEIIDSFYTTPFYDLPVRTFKSSLMRALRMCLYKINPHFSSKLLGGCSLIVVAK